MSVFLFFSKSSKSPASIANIRLTENKKTGLWNSIECWPIKRQGTWHASFPVWFVPSMIRRSLELAASLLRHRSAAETRHKSHDGNLLPSLCLCLFAVQHLYISHPVVLLFIWKCSNVTFILHIAQSFWLDRGIYAERYFRSESDEQSMWNSTAITVRKQIALTVARLPSWGLRCCRPEEPLFEQRSCEFRRKGG